MKSHTHNTNQLNWMSSSMNWNVLLSSLHFDANNCPKKIYIRFWAANCETKNAQNFQRWCLQCVLHAQLTLFICRTRSFQSFHMITYKATKSFQLHSNSSKDDVVEQVFVACHRNIGSLNSKQFFPKIKFNFRL